MLLLKLAVAVKETVALELTTAVAVAGLTMMLVIRGWPAPHAASRASNDIKQNAIMGFILS